MWHQSMFNTERAFVKSVGGKQMKKTWLPIIPVFLAILLLAACGGQQEQKGQESSDKQGQTKQQNEDFPVTITDAMDNEVTIKEKPEKIVSLVPSNTEMTFALGAGDRMVGVSDFANYPEEAADIEKIGGQEFNVEKIISLKPDLVLALDSNARNSKDGLDQIRDAGIQVLIVKSATSFADVYSTIERIAKATGTTDKGKDIIANMKAKVSDIKDKAAQIPKDDRVKVWAEVAPPPNVFTTGSETFMNEMLDIINAKNIASDEKGWTKYSLEDVVKEKPEAIVLTYKGDGVVKNVLNRDGWQSVPAVKNERVYNVDADLVSRPGPRLVKGVEALAEAIYPDVFKD